MSCHEDAALWLVRRGSPRPLIGWHGVTPGCRVTRLMLIITVGSQSEFVIVTLTRGRHGKWEGNSSDIPPTLTDYFCMCDSIFQWNLHFSIHPESDCKFTPGSYFCVSPARDRRLIMRTLLCHLCTPPPLWRWYQDLEGGYQPIRVQECDSVTNEKPLYLEINREIGAQVSPHLVLMRWQSIP